MMILKKILNAMTKYWFIYSAPYKHSGKIEKHKESILKELKDWYKEGEQKESQEKMDLMVELGEEHFKSLKKARNNLEKKTILLLVFLLSVCSFSCLKVAPLISNLTHVNHYLALILGILSCCYLLLASWVVLFGFRPKIEANAGEEPRSITKMISLPIDNVRVNLILSLQRKIYINHSINEKWATYFSSALAIAIALLAAAIVAFLFLLI